MRFICRAATPDRRVIDAIPMPIFSPYGTSGPRISARSLILPLPLWSPVSRIGRIPQERQVRFVLFSFPHLLKQGSNNRRSFSFFRGCIRTVISILSREACRRNVSVRTFSHLRCRNAIQDIVWYHSKMVLHPAVKV